jgi:hypothetical protein
MTGLSPLPGILSAAGPHWHAAIQKRCVYQNVVGLWLKYGVKSLKIRASLPFKILFRDKTICWHQALTTPIGRAYKPPTERGAALVLGQGMLSRP